MPRKLVLFAVLAVVGSMLVLWLVMRGDKKSESSADSSTTPSSSDSVAYSDRSTPSATRDRTKPALPGDPDQPVAPNTTEPSRDPNGRINAGTVTEVPRGTHADQLGEPLEYTLPDGRKVRDFRKPEDRRPLDVPPSIHPPGGRKIQPELTALFTDAIIGHIRECGTAVPQDVRAKNSRFEGQIVIAIKQEQASVTNAVFKLTNLGSESIAETARQCVEQKALTVKVPAKGEVDLDAYSINLALALL